MRDTFISEEDIAFLLASGSHIAEFCVRCNRSLQDFNEWRLGKRGFDLPDPVAMAVAIRPEIVTREIEAWAYVETGKGPAYGQLIIDHQHLMRKPPNARFCFELDAKRFKDLLFHLILENN